MQCSQTEHVHFRLSVLVACRFWGTPIPIWASEDGEEIRVIGSMAELEEIAGRKVG
jgi:hypothetical protein